jgi:hypothetical protein
MKAIDKLKGMDQGKVDRSPASRYFPELQIRKAASSNCESSQFITSILLGTLQIKLRIFVFPSPGMVIMEQRGSDT